MPDQNLSLIHLVREPERVPGAKPPMLLLLHGYGSNEADLFSMSPYLDARFFIVSARAPVTLMPGMHAWFNLEFTAQGIIPDLRQAEASQHLLLRFLDELVSVYPVDEQRVYLMGFSQGAMMSLTLALVRPQRFAGVVAMSGRLPESARAQMAEAKALTGLPIFVTHGLYDDLLPVQHGRETRAILETLPVDLSYKEYPMGHEVNPESFRDIRAWLSRLLDARPAQPNAATE